MQHRRDFPNISGWVFLSRGGFRHVQHVWPNRGPTRGPANFCNIATYRKQFCCLKLHTICVHNYVMRVLNKMSMMTTLSLCVSCEFSRAIRILGRDHWTSLLRLNPALFLRITLGYSCHWWKPAVGEEYLDRSHYHACPPRFFYLRSYELTFTFATVYVVVSPSVVCLSVTFVAIEFFGMFLRHLVRWPSADSQVNFFYGDRDRGTPPSGELNTRGVAEYSDFEPIVRYISETVQDRS